MSDSSRPKSFPWRHSGADSSPIDRDRPAGARLPGRVFGAGMYSSYLVKPVPSPPTGRQAAPVVDLGHLNPRIGLISHAHESCVAAGDADGDGRVEVALADGRKSTCSTGSWP